MLYHVASCRPICQVVSLDTCSTGGDGPHLLHQAVAGSQRILAGIGLLCSSPASSRHRPWHSPICAKGLLHRLVVIRQPDGSGHAASPSGSELGKSVPKLLFYFCCWLVAQHDQRQVPAPPHLLRRIRACEAGPRNGGQLQDNLRSHYALCFQSMPLQKSLVICSGVC